MRQPTASHSQLDRLSICSHDACVWKGVSMHSCCGRVIISSHLNSLKAIPYLQVGCLVRTLRTRRARQPDHRRCQATCARRGSLAGCSRQFCTHARPRWAQTHLPAAHCDGWCQQWGAPAALQTHAHTRHGRRAQPPARCWRPSDALRSAFWGLPRNAAAANAGQCTAFMASLAE